MKPAVVVVAHNRPHALQRLLASIGAAHYPENVPLVISIDPGGENYTAVTQIAAQFSWEYGRKRLIQHPRPLGLVEHVFFCGGLSQEYGSIILLEDDLVVSPRYYAYASQTLAFYDGDTRIGGLSLNSLWFNGYTHQPFVPYLDDGDVFFLQVAWYQGQAYTAAQWAAFDAWRTTATWRVTAADKMHELFHSFPDDDWFPFKTKYLVNNGRYYVFPRESLTTNFGDRGTHFARSTSFFQVPLQSLRRHFRLQPFDEAVAVYDSFFEMQPDRLNRLTSTFRDYDYEVDLYGTKSVANLRAGYVLTSKRSRAPLFSFGKAMWPLEANAVAAVPGQEIVFCPTDTLDLGRLALLQMQKSNHDYFSRRPISRKKRFLFWLLEIAQKAGLA